MPSDKNWKFSQCFGDKGDIENITEADIISTVEFDHTGDFLATGDKGEELFCLKELKPNRSKVVSINFYRIPKVMMPNLII